MIQNVISLSENGLCRQNNQDAILAVHTDNAGLFVVADGMGGHFKGELASQRVVSSLEAWWKGIQYCVLSLPFLDVVADLEKKVREINKDIFQMYKVIGENGGTTLCLLFIHHNAYAVLNVGDSRLYRCQGKKCMQMTMDDIWENQPQIRQSAKKDELVKNASCGKLVKAFGTQCHLQMSVITGLIEKRTCFLLCSDGIYKYIENRKLLSLLKKIQTKKDSSAVVEKMRKRVYRNGAGDNLSLIIVLANGNFSIGGRQK